MLMLLLQIFQDTMSDTLDGLAKCVDAAFHSVVPRPHGAGGAPPPEPEIQVPRVVRLLSGMAPLSIEGPGKEGAGWQEEVWELDSSQVSVQSVVGEEVGPPPPLPPTVAPPAGVLRRPSGERGPGALNPLLARRRSGPRTSSEHQPQPPPSPPQHPRGLLSIPRPLPVATPPQQQQQSPRGLANGEAPAAGWQQQSPRGLANGNAAAAGQPPGSTTPRRRLDTAGAAQPTSSPRRATTTSHGGPQQQQQQQQQPLGPVLPPLHLNLQRATPGSPLYFDLLEMYRRRTGSTPGGAVGRSALAASPLARQGGAPKAGQAGFVTGGSPTIAGQDPSPLLPRTPALQQQEQEQQWDGGQLAPGPVGVGGFPNHQSAGGPVDRLSTATDLSVWATLEPETKFRVIGSSYVRLIPVGTQVRGRGLLWSGVRGEEMEGL